MLPQDLLKKMQVKMEEQLSDATFPSTVRKEHLEESGPLTMESIKKAFIRAAIGHPNIHFTEHLPDAEHIFTVDATRYTPEYMIVPAQLVDNLYEELMVAIAEENRKRNLEN